MTRKYVNRPRTLDGRLKLGSLLFQNSVVSFETDNYWFRYRSWEPPETGPELGRTDSVSQEVLKHLYCIYFSSHMANTY